MFFCFVRHFDFGVVSLSNLRVSASRRLERKYCGSGHLQPQGAGSSLYIYLFFFFIQFIYLFLFIYLPLLFWKGIGIQTTEMNEYNTRPNSYQTIDLIHLETSPALNLTIFMLILIKLIIRFYTILT